MLPKTNAALRWVSQGEAFVKRAFYVEKRKPTDALPVEEELLFSFIFAAGGQTATNMPLTFVLV